ncbi:hypothetical protein U3516DRAFT_884810 [Neocallimastix sp. 'constans']|jgi:lysophospholipase L1-like esterase
MAATHSFKPTKDNVKISGRTLYKDDALWVGHTGSGIEYKFNGKTTTIILSPDSIYGALSEEFPAHIFVYGDGKLYIDTLTTKSTMELTVTFDEVKEHIVRLLKVSECEKGFVYIKEIKTDSDKITPTPANEKKIEFIGDSLVCGFGALDTEGGFTTKTEDGTKSFFYKVAQKFHADFNTFAFSGYGVYSGVTFTGIRNVALLLPPLYNKLGNCAWNHLHPEATTLAVSDVEWDHHEFEPDLIVINLGTNDGSFIQGIKDDKTREEERLNFMNTYTDFIKTIRSIHPNAEILCTLGMMDQELCTEVENLVKQYRSDTNDTKVNAFRLKLHDVKKNGIAILNHPNYLSHVDAAYELIGAIEKLYGWTSDPNVDINEPLRH